MSTGYPWTDALTGLIEAATLAAKSSQEVRHAAQRANVDSEQPKMHQPPEIAQIHLPGALSDAQAAELLTLSTVGAAFKYLDIRKVLWLQAQPRKPMQGVAVFDELSAAQAYIRANWRGV